MFRKDEKLPNAIIVEARFDLTLKSLETTKEKEKGSFTAQGFGETEKLIIVQGTAILRVTSIRRILPAETFHNFCLLSYNVI